MRRDRGQMPVRSGQKNMRQMFLFQANHVEQEDAKVFQAGKARSGAGCRIRERVVKQGPGRAQLPGAFVGVVGRT
jgi:hypothetical protein